MSWNRAGLAALVAAGAAALWVGAGWLHGEDPEPERATPADEAGAHDTAPWRPEGPGSAASAPPPESAGTAPPREPPPAPLPSEPPDPGERVRALFDDSAPDVLRETFERVAAGRPIDPRDAVAVYEHGQDHPRDPRAALVLGYDAMNRQWTEFGFEHYRRAYGADPEVRWDPRVMADLLEATESSQHRNGALATIQELYAADGPADLARHMEAARRDDGEVLASMLRHLGEALGH